VVGLAATRTRRLFFRMFDMCLWEVVFRMNVCFCMSLYLLYQLRLESPVSLNAV
jgi:hypothetical protein